MKDYYICSVLLLIVAIGQILEHNDIINVGCLGLKKSSAGENTVALSSGLMCCGTMAYSRTALLMIGLNVLMQSTTLRLPLNTYRTLQELDICDVLPTYRGKRCGISKKKISDPVPTHFLFTKCKVNF